MNENAVRVIRWYGLSELLDGPLSRWMGGQIHMKQPSAGMLYNDKHIKYTKGCGHRYAEVTCHDALGVIADKGRSALRLTAFARTADAVTRHVFAHGSW